MLRLHLANWRRNPAFQAEMGIYKRKQENTLSAKKAIKKKKKKKRKHPLDQERDKEQNDNSQEKKKKKGRKHPLGQESG